MPRYCAILVLLLAKPRNDQILLAMVNIFQSFMACNFLKSSLTFSLVNTCLRKTISFWTKLTFGYVGKKLLCWNYFKMYLSVPHALWQSWNTTRYYQYKWSWIHLTFHEKLSSRKLWISMGHYTIQLAWLIKTIRNFHSHQFNILIHYVDLIVFQLNIKSIKVFNPIESIFRFSMQGRG
jgi:hypothetical protein